MTEPDREPTPETLLSRTVFGFRTLGICLCVANGVLSVLLAGFLLKEWVFGRTIHYDFSRVASSHLDRSDFEAEFIRRVTAKGYVIFNCRVTRNDDDTYYDGWITLREVTTRDRQVDHDLHEVMKSFTDQPVQVEKP